MEIQELAIRYLEGSLSEAEKLELSTRMEADEAFAAAMTAEMLDATLFVKLASNVEALAPEENGLVLPFQEPVIGAKDRAHAPYADQRRRHRRRNNLSRLTAIAAVLVLCLVLSYTFELWGPGTTDDDLLTQSVYEVELLLEADTQISWLRKGALIEPTESSTVLPGDSLELHSGSASLRFRDDGTTIHLARGCRLALLDPSPGKSLQLLSGSVTASVMPQPEDRPMILETPIARVTVLGTVFTADADTESTEVNVIEGKVAVRRHSDDAEVQVDAGNYTTIDSVQQPLSWEMAFAVNLGGKAVTIDGNRWLSHKEALEQGMQLRTSKGNLFRGGKRQTMAVKSLPEDLHEMLTTNIYSRTDDFFLDVPLPNGRYQAFLWLRQNIADFDWHHHLFIEGEALGSGIGANLKRAQWERYGPYEFSVVDGEMNLALEADPDASHKRSQLYGIAVFAPSSTKP